MRIRFERALEAVLVTKIKVGYYPSIRLEVQRKTTNLGLYSLYPGRQSALTNLLCPNYKYEIISKWVLD